MASLPNIFSRLVRARAAAWMLLALAAPAMLSGCRLGTADAAMKGRDLFETCAACHGQLGEGNPEFGAPNIAGMQSWYVESQLKKFRSGARGAHFSDVEGMRMRPMAMSLDSDEAVHTVAEFVGKLSAVTTPPTIGGDAAAGDSAYHLACAACHGPNGEGNEALKAPRLTGVADWYLALQLRKIKGGIRGSSPLDIEGRLMSAFARRLADEEAIRNVVAYLDTLKP